MIYNVPEDLEPGQSIPVQNVGMDTVDEIRQGVIVRPAATIGTPIPRYLVYQYQFLKAEAEGDEPKQISKRYECESMDAALFMAEKFVSRFLPN